MGAKYEVGERTIPHLASHVPTLHSKDAVFADLLLKDISVREYLRVHNVS